MATDHKIDLENIFNLPFSFNVPLINKHEEPKKKKLNNNKMVTIKYFGNIEGKFGIASKKIENYLNPIKPEIHLAITSRTLETKEKTLFKTKEIKLNQNFNKTKNNLFNKKALERIQNISEIKYKEGVGVGMDQESDLLNIEKNQFNNTNSKNKIKTKIINSVSINSGLIDTINYEVNNKSNYNNKKNNLMSNTTTNFQFVSSQYSNSPWDIKERPLTTCDQKNKYKLPFIIQQMMNKKGVSSKSELIYPDRYRKPKIKIEELLSHHNALSRTAMSSHKVNDYNMKIAVGVDGITNRLKSGIKMKKENTKKEIIKKSMEITNYKFL